jgi:hypothetical protein
MLLYLYADNNLRKAGKKIAAQLSNRLGLMRAKPCVHERKFCI